jgi:hypothetical protein
MTHPDHTCSACGRRAFWGYGVRLLKGEPGTWYCRAHRPAEPEAKPLEQVVIPKAPAEQGALL